MLATIFNICAQDFIDDQDIIYMSSFVNVNEVFFGDNYVVMTWPVNTTTAILVRRI